MRYFITNTEKAKIKQGDDILTIRIAKFRKADNVRCYELELTDNLTALSRQASVFLIPTGTCLKEKLLFHSCPSHSLCSFGFLALCCPRSSHPFRPILWAPQASSSPVSPSWICLQSFFCLLLLILYEPKSLWDHAGNSQQQRVPLKNLVGEPHSMPTTSHVSRKPKVWNWREDQLF